MENVHPGSGELLPELNFTTSRSSGPGGQNVNKVNSKVTMKWDVVNSVVVTAEQKDIILKKLSKWITKDGVLMITAQSSRSQLENKEDVTAKLDGLLVEAFIVRKPRKKRKTSASAKLKRLDNKKRSSEKKQWRKKID